MRLVLTFILCLFSWAASAQSITVTPAIPAPTCGASTGTTVATLSASGLPSGVLTSSWVLSGDTTHYQIANNLLNSASLVVGSAGICNPGTALISIASPSGSVALASATFVGCAYGPNFTGSLPADVATAGFNTCVMNSDFRTGSFASTSAWLDCAGATSPIWYATTYNVGPNPPCSRYFMTTDTDTTTGGSVQVLDVQYTPTDATNGSYGTELSYGCSGATSGCGAAQNGMFLPAFAFYIEWRHRLTTNTYQCSRAGSCEPFDFFTWSAAPGESTAAFFEIDFLEQYSLSGSCCAFNDAGGGGGPWGTASGGLSSCPPPSYPQADPGCFGRQSGYNAVEYQTYGELYTTDGVSNIAVCTYFAAGGASATPVKHSCTTGTASPQFTVNGLHQPAGFYIGTGNNGPSQDFPPATRDGLWEYVRIFSCSNWKNGNCAGTMVTQ